MHLAMTSPSPNSSTTHTRSTPACSPTISCFPPRKKSPINFEVGSRIFFSFGKWLYIVLHRELHSTPSKEATHYRALSCKRALFYDNIPGINQTTQYRQFSHFFALHFVPRLKTAWSEIFALQHESDITESLNKCV